MIIEVLFSPGLDPRVYELRNEGRQVIPGFLHLGHGIQKDDSRRGDGYDLPQVEGQRILSGFKSSALGQKFPDLETGHCLLDKLTAQDTILETYGVASLPLQNDLNYLHLGQHVDNSSGDKKHHSKIEKCSIVEEEQKIFASLERLDWKLAAIGLRTRNVGRESTVSQGQQSMMSAPAVMRPPPRTVMERFSLSRKKGLPYSAIPPRPLVS